MHGKLLVGRRGVWANPACRSFYTVGFSLAKRKGSARIYLVCAGQGFADHGKVAANDSKAMGFVPAAATVFC
jgi:hypothetical protein